MNEMNEWQETKWGEIATLEYGKSLRGYQEKTSGFRVYGTNGPIGWHDEYLCDQPGVIIGRKGAYRGVHYSPTPFFVIDTAFYLNPKTEIDIRWAYYALLLCDINNMDSGSAIPSTSRADFYNLPVTIPPLAVQRRIAEILGALDDKIANNAAINHHLEQIAQAIYEQKFGMQNDLVTPISEIVDIRDGTHDSPKAVDSGYPLVTSKHLLPYGVDVITPNLICQADFDKINERSKVDTHDILISMIGTIGLISLVIEREVNFAIKNVGLFKTSQIKEFVYYVLCFLRSPAMRDHIDIRLAGSTQKFISLGELRQLPIAVPSKEELHGFNDIVRPMFDEIELRTVESAHLAAIRDALLPRLMSGELPIVDISNIK